MLYLLIVTILFTSCDPSAYIKHSLKIFLLMCFQFKILVKNTIRNADILGILEKNNFQIPFFFMNI